MDSLTPEKASLKQDRNFGGFFIWCCSGSPQLSIPELDATLQPSTAYKKFTGFTELSSGEAAVLEGCKVLFQHG